MNFVCKKCGAPGHSKETNRGRYTKCSSCGQLTTLEIQGTSSQLAPVENSAVTENTEPKIIVDKPMVSWADDQLTQNAPRQLRGNALGIMSLILSVIALCISTYSSNIIQTLQQRKIPDRQYRTDDLTQLTDKAANTITFFEQAVVFLFGGLVCGTIAFIAFLTGCAGLVRKPRLPGAIGVCLSIAACKILFG